MNKQDIKKLIDDISNATEGCAIQHNGSPCRTCFYALKIDYSHLAWLLLLALRGDYTYKELQPNLKECLKGGK